MENCLPTKHISVPIFSRWGLYIKSRRLPRWISGKEPACQSRRCRFDPWVGKILWRRKWQPTPIFLPGEDHGQRSLAGYSPWDHRELDTIKRLTLWLPSNFTLSWECNGKILMKRLYGGKCKMFANGNFSNRKVRNPVGNFPLHQLAPWQFLTLSHPSKKVYSYHFTLIHS